MISNLSSSGPHHPSNLVRELQCKCLLPDLLHAPKQMNVQVDSRVSKIQRVVVTDERTTGSDEAGEGVDMDSGNDASFCWCVGQRPSHGCNDQVDRQAPHGNGCG